MIIKVQMDKVVIAYVQSKLGSEPLRYNSKNHISIFLFQLFKCKSKFDKTVPPGVHYLEIVVPDLFISEKRTYFSLEAIRAFEAAMRNQLEEQLVDLVFEKKCTEGVKYKQAVEYGLAKFGLTEEIMPYQTLWKRVQRKRNRLESKAA